MSMNKAMIILNKLKEKFGGEVTISMNGVPYLRCVDRNYCWFKRTDIVREFIHNEIEGGQTRIDHKVNDLLQSGIAS